ncbi:MAG: 2-amino-4,5-dihydroxy-6-one-heptanoic acid-7-phosphate synthase [Actinobacteria bacterium]|nr:2-amino-4,5-dihydroxy-6-one-heptanoic acid-7-phosphate synthase [Actinomycetota bacterium]
MPPSLSFARGMRLSRLSRHDDGRMLIVPLDHSVTDGPTFRGRHEHTVARLVGNGVDGIVVHKGRLRHMDPAWFTSMALFVHLSASTRHAVDPDAKYLVASVDEALRLGADAVSMHVNLGSPQEQVQIADLAAVADACDRWNVPLLAMVYPRGPAIVNQHDAALVAHAVTLAADLGADLVKTVDADTVAEMADIVSACPIPVLAAGGPPRRTASEVLSYVDDVLAAGAAGVAMGRTIFQAPDPGEAARLVSERIHGVPPSPRALAAQLAEAGSRGPW